MTLTIGDHLVIKRRGNILTEDSGEAYHEFEVLVCDYMPTIAADDKSVLYRVTLKVTK